MNERTTLRIKEWFVDKEADKAARYNMFFEYFKRNENGTRIVENGYIELICEKLAESEKAVKVTIQTGDVVGSTKGWTTWVPKSQIA